MLRIVEFKTEYHANRDPVDWVLIAPQGEDFEKTQTWHRVSKITPPEHPDNNMKASASYQDMVAKWTVIGPAYESWKHGNELPETGTPLAAWSGVTAEQAKALASLDVRTVEDVRDMSDGVMAKLRLPNARQLPKLAKDYLEGSSIAEKDAKLVEMEEKMAAMEALLEEQMKANQPKKRGRPPKAEVEAA